MTTTVYLDNGCRCTDPGCDDEHAEIATLLLWHDNDEGGNTYYANVNDLLIDMTDPRGPVYETGDGYVTDLETGETYDAAAFRDAHL